jgi:hypothetical protein
MPHHPVRTLILAVALLVAAILAAPAAGAGPAARFAPGSPAAIAAQRIAVAHWGVDPCGGDVAIRWRRAPRLVNAVAHWSIPVPDTGPAAHRDCVIVFNPRETFAWPKFCTVIVHEYGHLLGLGHTADPGDVMAEVYRRPLRACR